MSLFPVHEKSEAHLRECLACRDRSAPTGSGLCIIGFRLSLAAMTELDRVLASIIYV